VAEPNGMYSQAEPGNKQRQLTGSFPGSAWECIPGGSSTSYYAQIAELESAKNEKKYKHFHINLHD